MLTIYRKWLLGVHLVDWIIVFAADTFRLVSLRTPVQWHWCSRRTPAQYFSGYLRLKQGCCSKGYDWQIFHNVHSFDMYGFSPEIGRERVEKDEIRTRSPLQFFRRCFGRFFSLIMKVLHIFSRKCEWHKKDRYKQKSGRYTATMTVENKLSNREKMNRSPFIGVVLRHLGFISAYTSNGATIPWVWALTNWKFL